KRSMSGVLALQLHAGQPMAAEFRNMRLKKLTASASSGGDDLQKLQGSWQVASGQANGEPLPVEMITNISLTITGTNYSAIMSDRNDKGSFTIDPSKQPRQMDIQSESSENTHLAGIYEAGADRLRICFSPQGGAR